MERMWLRREKHLEEDSRRLPNNATCNGCISSIAMRFGAGIHCCRAERLEKTFGLRIVGEGDSECFENLSKTEKSHRVSPFILSHVEGLR